MFRNEGFWFSVVVILFCFVLFFKKNVLLILPGGNHPQIIPLSSFRDT